MDQALKKVLVIKDDNSSVVDALSDFSWLDTVFKKKMEIYDLDPYFLKVITCLKIKNTFVM